MKLLSFDYQFVANLAAHNEDDDFVAFNIIQRAKVSRPKFEFGKRVRPKPFDGSCRRIRVVLQAGQYGCFQDSLFACGQGLKLSLPLLRDRNLVCHGNNLSRGEVYTGPKP
jgi:hypothetical protein